MSLFPSDCGQFDNAVVPGNKVLVNNSENALLKWRYTLESNEVPPAVITCYFEESGDMKFVIIRTGTANPQVQVNGIRNTTLAGRVQGYVNSTDNTIFGFTINNANENDPNEYLCVVNFNLRNSEGRSVPSTPKFSNRLVLQVLGNIARLFFYLIQKTIFLFFET